MIIDRVKFYLMWGHINQELEASDAKTEGERSWIRVLKSGYSLLLS